MRICSYHAEKNQDALIASVIEADSTPRLLDHVANFCGQRERRSLDSWQSVCAFEWCANSHCTQHQLVLLSYSPVRWQKWLLWQCGEKLWWPQYNTGSFCDMNWLSLFLKFTSWNYSTPAPANAPVIGMTAGVGGMGRWRNGAGKTRES